MADKKVNTGYGILCYLGILIIIPFMDEKFKNSQYGKFHLNQGLVLFIVSLALFFAWWFLIFIPFLWLLMPLIWLGWFVLWLMAVINAGSGKMQKLPLIVDIELVK